MFGVCEQRMTEAFRMKIDEIQPSQLFISSEKLSQVMRSFDPIKPVSIEPIPVKKLRNKVIFVDGHTRALAAFLHGLSEIPVYWEDDELDWDAYEICVDWCQKEGINTIADLENRVVPHQEYEVIWYKRCERMQQSLEAKRKQRTHETKF